MIDVTEHMKLAYKETWKIYNKVNLKYEFEDIFQIACLGLVKAGNAFDENKGVEFSTYATPTIRGELLNYIGRDKKYNVRKGIPHKFTVMSYEAERETGSLENRIGTDSFEERLIIKADLNQAIENLNVEEKQVLKLYFVKNLLQSEIAEILNTSQNQVSRIKRRISKKIRLAFADCEKVIM